MIGIEKDLIRAKQLLLFLIKIGGNYDKYRGGLNSVKDIYIGNKKVTKAYVGNKLVYKNKNKIWLVQNGIIKDLNLWNSRYFTYPGNGTISNYGGYQSFLVVGSGMGLQMAFNNPNGQYKLFIKGTVGVYLQSTYSGYASTNELGCNINNKNSGAVTPTGYSPKSYSLEYTFNGYTEGEICYYGPYSGYLINTYLASRNVSTFYAHIYFKDNASLYAIESA